MKIIKKIFLGFLKFLLALSCALTITIIVLNLGIILSNKYVKTDFPTLLDYTYLTVPNNEIYLNYNKGDLLIIDFVVTTKPNDKIVYKDQDEYKLAKVIDIELEKDISIKNDKEEKYIKKQDVYGTIIYSIPKIGKYVSLALSNIGLIIAIIALIIISIIQGIIAKKKKKKKSINPKK